MTRSQKRDLLRIIAAAVLLAAAYGVTALLKADGVVKLLIFLVPYLTVGWPVLLKAGRNIAAGQVFDENFLMALATIGALAIGEYPEAVFVMLFYQIGELFEHVAVGRSRKSIAALMDIRPDTANLETENGIEETDPEEVAVGSVIVVRPGEKVPIDGTVIEGASDMDTMALTGESLPRSVGVGESVISGCVSMTGTLRIRTEKLFGDSTVSRILDLVENSTSNKARSENFISRFSKWYTPVVVIGAVILAIVPSLITGDWAKWIHQALTFLVISCPCALVLSVPLSFFGGIGGASRQGILIKGSNYLEMLAGADCAVFDKTGTLTKGAFAVREVCPRGVSARELLETAALAERDSHHPIAASVRAACDPAPDPHRVRDIKEISGRGVKALADGAAVAAGNLALMAQCGVEGESVSAPGTVIHVARDGQYLGYIIIADQVKEESCQVISSLKERGVRTVMLTGDRRAVAEAVASDLGVDEVKAELLPEDKVKAVEELLARRQGKGKLIFCGDGINDAPVIARADVGFAMGALGSDAAIEAADVVIMDDDLRKIAKAMDISRKTNRIVTENIAFAILTKVIVLGLGILGMATMWEAIFADVGVLVLCVLNA
ncbi:MAG: cadmium-translocating P-type ATPase, partial [Oscillospiraceae bacterium]|nr:cadmium-translocating P-type ATPase [Oscillospiraceae bacterium]